MITRFSRLIVGLLAIAGMLTLAACSGSSSSHGSGGATEAKGLKVGWSTVYPTPSWMQEMQKLFDTRVATLKFDGVIGS
ncbi:hypothetical protein [Jatrophihabitans lederbergiae]|uniref:Sugar ABC transporter substrate-binding protein n=1 Tax=Jatrophihabitans lederbergiae TaxID=3075547 RepID=A0ABU2JF21_9ACTN|nr:hypothetical protein [Jatrophihabitans sp. DSM 44399]MDT0263594.1 hypothetical protein [Jatrophihabitans sp. DSM 44399]